MVINLILRNRKWKNSMPVKLDINSMLLVLVNTSRYTTPIVVALEVTAYSIKIS